MPKRRYRKPFSRLIKIGPVSGAREIFKLAGSYHFERIIYEVALALAAEEKRAPAS
jgi:hypothetical protein